MKKKIDVAALLERIKAAGPGAPISRAEATALVASRTMEAHDTLRSARNRVGVQLDRAILLGKAGHGVFSGGITPLAGGGFTTDELGRWANRRYENRFGDVPLKPRDCNTGCRENIGMGADAGVTFLPGDLERAHAMILQFLAEKQETESKFFRAMEERNRALGARFTQTKK